MLATAGKYAKEQMQSNHRLVIYHNSACSKSREAVALLHERVENFDIVEYLKAPISEASLRHLLDQLDEPAAALVRKDKRFAALGLDADDYVTKDAVVRLLIEYPELMQRPIILQGERAVIARPIDKVDALL